MTLQSQWDNISAVEWMEEERAQPGLRLASKVVVLGEVSQWGEPAALEVGRFDKDMASTAHGQVAAVALMGVEPQEVPATLALAERSTPPVAEVFPIIGSGGRRPARAGTCPDLAG